MVVHEVFEVLYSPVKAFKKIVEKPDFKGVLLILVLFMSFTVVEQYVVASKLLLLDQTPDNDDWTALWASNGLLSIDDVDYKAGNYSVKSFVSNSTSIWMNITDIGPLDCSEDTGYEELFFWIKWIHPNETFPSSGALRLFSDTESYFELNLTSFIASSDEWSNATLKIGPDQGWNLTNSQDWKSVTGLEFRLSWPALANLTIKIDDLRFQKYVSSLETGAFSGSIIPILMSAAVVFSLNWILWTIILLMIAKVFREGGVSGTVFFVIIGHVFIVTVVYTIASAVLFSMLPVLNLPLKAPPATEEELNTTTALVEERWHPNWAYWGYLLSSGLYLPFVRELWIMALCVIAIRLLRGITWGKATSISIVAFIIRSTLRFFFGI